MGILFKCSLSAGLKVLKESFTSEHLSQRSIWSKEEYYYSSGYLLSWNRGTTVICRGINITEMGAAAGVGLYAYIRLATTQMGGCKGAVLCLLN